MHLHNGRNKIIKLFEDKDIKPSDFRHNTKLESQIELELKLELESDLKPELPFDESISERKK